MNYKKYKAILENKEFLIEEDNQDVGFYLYVYENGKCIKDYLQDTLEIVKNIALENYNVPLDIWQETTINHELFP